MGINYYSILQLKRHCTRDDVQNAFGKLVSKYSITNQVHERNLITLCESYEILSDPFRRALYDQYGEEGIKKGVQSDDFSIDPWIYHGDVLTTYSNYFALKNPISHLFIKSKCSVLLDLKKKKSYPNIVKLSLKLTLNEIFNGSVKLVEVKNKLTKISDSVSTVMQIVKVNVPRGFPTGGTLVSEVSKSTNSLEDVKIVYIFTTEDKPHKIFKRDNMNLIMIKKVSLKQALCGIQINIETLDHKFLRVNITQVITQDYIKIIANEGMPNMNNLTKRGAIIIKFDIIYPLYLSIADKTLCDLFSDDKIKPK